MTKEAAKKPAETSSGQALAEVDLKSGQLPAQYEEFMTGPSDFAQNDISIPFIRILQGLSPQVNPEDAKYIEGARQGQILENVSPKVIDGKEKGIYVIVSLYERSYTEWKPSRGGFVADHGSDPAILKQITREENSNGKRVMVFSDTGNELNEAALYYVNWAEDPAGPWNQALLAMGGTQWKTARDWNRNMSQVKLTNSKGERIANPLPFAMIYHLTTVGMEKDNNKFYGWKVEPHCYTLAVDQANPAVGAMLVQAAFDFRKLALEGKIKGVQDEAPEPTEPQDKKEPF